MGSISFTMYVSFFFSSRRRHTRLQGDWSSDVCSSDLDQCAVVVDQAWQEPEMDDRAVTCRREVDHLADGGGFLVTGDDEGTRRDLARIASLIEEGPDIARLVFVVEVGGDVHVVHLSAPLGSVSGGGAGRY